MKKLIYIFALMIFVAGTIFAQETAVMFHQQIEWSPDGKSLIFTGMRNFDPKTNNFESDIYIIKTDGKGLVKITGDTKNEFYSDWTRDGRYVVFNADDKATKTSDLGFAGRKKDRVYFHPRRRKISDLRDGYLRPKRQAADQRSQRGFFQSRLVAGRKKASLLHGKRRSPRSDLGDERRRFKPDLAHRKYGSQYFPSWSSDGKQILFSSSNRELSGSGSYVEGSFLYTMNADGTSLARLAGNINSFFARFSPGGKKIAFIMGKFPSTNIYIANADGSGAIQITK
jgi:Tol biopolymer transport system component